MNHTEALEQLTMLGIPPEDAEESLRKNNYNVERAANYYYNGDLERDRSANKWDETAFSQGRYGESMDVPAIHHPQPSKLNSLAQAADMVLRDPPGAKSRPPSRSFQITPHDGDALDPDIQQAIKASMEDSQQSQPYTGPQVTGTVGYTGTSNFRPADNNTYHDPNSWAVTVSGPSESAVEIFLDPAPIERKRLPGQPAFLRPSTGSGSLGPLFTILYNIPLARETILQREHILEDYGHNEQWWAGHVIQLPRVVVEDESNGVPTEEIEIIRESQRLMAFLEGTDRAYGTAESLGSLPNVFDLDPSNIVPRFFQSFQAAAKYINGDPKYRTALESKAVRVGPGMDPHSQTFEVFDLYVSGYLIDQGGTLYDALDSMFWEGEGEGEGVETYAEYIGDVCTIQVRTEENHRPCGVDIPSELYFDRYTERFKDEFAKMKKSRDELRLQIEQIEEKERRIRLYSPMSQPHRNLDMMKVMGTTRMYFEQSSNSDHLIGEEAVAEAEHAKQCAEVAKQLADIEGRIQKKIEALKSQKDELRTTLDKLKSIFTSPENTTENAPPLTKYVLRGVSTDKGITYVRRKKIVPIIDIEHENAPAETTSQNEWWTMKYLTNQQLSYSDEQYGSYEIKTVLEEEVLRAARFEGQGIVLLVYAKEDTDEAELEDVALPEPLKQFVAQDNRYFSAEITNAASKPQSQSRKRRHDLTAATDIPPVGDHLSYMAQWTAGLATNNSSRVATPGDSRRNSAEFDATMDTGELTAIPEPPSPPTTSHGHSVHFAVDHEPGFRGAYGTTHEMMAVDEIPRGPPANRHGADDTDDEMTYGSQHLEIATDGTLQPVPIPPIPPPPVPPPPINVVANGPPPARAPRLDLED
ncbi:hypothetical protein ABW19_dt0206590 [Dactylella cylindrospora]|nr:hypothetical protein ABW19_dt0206590 [Dactylella cylindrospora]